MSEENSKIYYVVEYKENPEKIIRTGGYNNYNMAEDEFKRDKEFHKGVKLIKVSEEIIDEQDSKNSFVVFDCVKIIKHCRLQGLVGLIENIDEFGNIEINIRIGQCGDNDRFIMYKGKVEDIEKCEKSGTGYPDNT